MFGCKGIDSLFRRDCMAVWEYVEDVDHYQSICLVNEDDGRLLIDHFKGKPFPGLWRSLPVYYPDWEDLMAGATEEEKTWWTPPKRNLPRGDFPYLAAVPVFSERAVNELLPLIEQSVQVLSLACDEDNLYIINVIDVVDCLDKTLSKLKHFSQGGVMRIEHHVFREEAIHDKHFFKIPELSVPVYTSDTFKAVVEDKGLKGLLWKPLP
jgi:hypothetical protein